MRYTAQTEKKKAEYVANNIGISGFKYVLGTNVSKIRRVVWLFVILLASAWMIWNIRGRVSYFLSRPSTITTGMKFKDKLMFPKITICNQNTFRSTKVYDEDHIPRTSPTVYEAIDRYLRVLRDDNGNQSLIQNVIDRYGAILSNINTLDFYRRAAHQKTTMIQRCTWKGKPCGPENFTEVFTNMGICFQFNVNQDDFIVDQTNKEGGLTLDLFVDHFDYMRDPQTRAGVLVVITDHNETDVLAKEQGIGFSVGQYVSVGLRRSEVTDLPPPHGSCGSAELKNYPPDEPYTYRKCHLNCLTSFIKRKCGCVDVYMPGQDTHVCSLLKNLECARPNEQLFYQSQEIRRCVCPSPCHAVTYFPSTSAAEFSDPFKQRLTLSKPAVTVDKVNRAAMVQAWSLFNAISPDITDLLAQMGLTQIEYRTTWTDLFSSFFTLVEQVRYLMEFVEDHDIRYEVSTAMKPEQEVNTTWDELEAAYDDLVYRADHHYYSITHIPLWSADFNTEAEVIILEDLFDWEYLYRDLYFRSSFAENSIEVINKYRSLFVNFTSAVSTTTNNLTISDWNISALMETTADLLSEARRLERISAEQTDKLHGPYESALEGVKDIATAPYYTLTSDFYNDNLLKMEIYFNDLGIQTSKKSPAYSAEGLVCDIGGSIGLCLGGSILTLVEVCDIIAIIYGSRRKDALASVSSGNNDGD